MRIALVLTFMLLATGGGFGQRAPNPVGDMPRDAEIQALVSEAETKVKELDRALTAAKPLFDGGDPGAYADDKEACSKTLQITAAIKKNGTTAYGLVALLSALDDLTLDVARVSPILVEVLRTIPEGRRDASTLALASLAKDGEACGDLSSLVLYATLRFVAGEDIILRAALKPHK